MLKKLLPLAAALAISASPAFAQISDGAIIANKAPPQSPIDTPNQTREGFVWAAPYYAWRNNDYVLMEGRWLPARPGYRDVAPRWVEENGRYRFVDESWVFDEDRTYGRSTNETSRTR